MAVAGLYRRILPSPPAIEFASSEGKVSVPPHILLGPLLCVLRGKPARARVFLLGMAVRSKLSFTFRWHRFKIAFPGSGYSVLSTY